MKKARTIEEIKDASTSPAKRRGWRIVDSLEKAANELLNGDYKNATQHAQAAKAQAEMMVEETEAELKTTKEKVHEAVLENEIAENKLEKATLSLVKAENETEIAKDVTEEWANLICRAAAAAEYMAEALNAID